MWWKYRQSSAHRVTLDAKILIMASRSPGRKRCLLRNVLSCAVTRAISRRRFSHRGYQHRGEQVTVSPYARCGCIISSYIATSECINMRGLRGDAWETGRQRTTRCNHYTRGRPRISALMVRADEGDRSRSGGECRERARPVFSEKHTRPPWAPRGI